MKIRNMVIGGLAGIVLGLTACDPDDPPTSDSGYDASSDAGNPDGGPPDSGYDGGLDAGYDAGNPDGGNDGGQSNLSPVVIIEAKDDQGNVKTEFNVGETVYWNIKKSYDPDCQTKNKCEGVGTYLPQCNNGIDYCRRDESTGSSGLFFPDGELVVGYGANNQNQSINFHVKCFDLETKGIDESIRPFGESNYNILIK